MTAFNHKRDHLDLRAVHFVKLGSKNLPALAKVFNARQVNFVHTAIDVRHFKLDLRDIRPSVIKTKHDPVRENRVDIDRSGAVINVRTAKRGGVVQVHVDLLECFRERRHNRRAEITVLRVGAGKARQRRLVKITRRRRHRRNVRIGRIRRNRRHETTIFTPVNVQLAIDLTAHIHK